MTKGLLRSSQTKYTLYKQTISRQTTDKAYDDYIRYFNMYNTN